MATAACGGVVTSHEGQGDGSSNLGSGHTNGTTQTAQGGSSAVSPPSSGTSGSVSTTTAPNQGGASSTSPFAGSGFDPGGFAGGGATSYLPYSPSGEGPGQNDQFARCTCADPTAPMTTLEQCQNACVAGNLAGCNWGNLGCAVGMAGQACGCAPVGLLKPNGDLCYVTGQWHTHSAPWNGMSTDATIELHADGTLHGSPEFSGKWSLNGSYLAISETVGADMTCEFPDTWTLTFSDDCNTAPLIPQGSGCTGARRYLDWNVTLTRF